MKLASVIVIAAAAVLVFSLAADARGNCPLRSDNLDDFAHCMVPLGDSVGTAAVYSSGEYDSHAASLMHAMAVGNVTPPQVMPAAFPAVGYFNPYFRFANTYVSGYVGFAAPYAMNPYWFGYRR